MVAFIVILIIIYINALMVFFNFFLVLPNVFILLLIVIILRLQTALCLKVVLRVLRRPRFTHFIK